MLRQVIARVERLISPYCVLTIVSRQHLLYAQEEINDRPPETVIAQPYEVRRVCSWTERGEAGLEPERTRRKET